MLAEHFSKSVDEVDENSEDLAIDDDYDQEIPEKSRAALKKRRERQFWARYCDSGCNFGALGEWQLRLQSMIRKLCNSTYSTKLQLLNLVGALGELEECKRCSELEQTGGGSCNPVEECQDHVRWLGKAVAPHFPTMRTLMRQIYRLREKVAWLVDAEESFQRGDITRLLKLYKDMGSPGKTDDDDETTGMVLKDQDVGYIREGELLQLLEPVVDEYHSAVADTPHRYCNICLERKRIRDLKEGIGGGRSGKRVTFGRDSSGTPVFAPLQDLNLSHLHNLFYCIWGGAMIYMCKKCYARMSIPGSSSRHRPMLDDLTALSIGVSIRDQLAGGDVRHPSLLKEAHHFKYLPPYSIFNRCFLDEIPREIINLINAGPIQLNLIRRFKTFMSIIKLQTVSGKTPFPSQAIVGNQAIFPLGMEQNMDVVSKAHKYILPNGKFCKFIVDRISKSSAEARHYLIDRRLVSVAIEWLKARNPDYKNVINGLLQEGEEWVSEAQVIQASGLEVEADEDDDGDQLHVIQEGDKPDPVLKANLRHLGKGEAKAGYSACGIVDDALRTSKTDLEKFLDDKVDAIPLSGFDPAMESKPFIELYPKGRWGLSEQRMCRLTEGRFVTHQLKLIDPRFCECKEWIFSMVNRKMLRQITSSAYATTRTGAWSKDARGRITGKTVKADLERVKAKQLDARLGLTFRNVVGSWAYFNSQRQSLEALICARGHPSFFLTISNADYNDNRLRDYLCSLPSTLNNLEDLSLSFLINNNPIATSEFYKLKMDSLLKLLLWNNDTKKSTRNSLLNYLAKITGVGVDQLKKIKWADQEEPNDDDDGRRRNDEDVGEDDFVERDAEELVIRATTRVKGVGILGVVLEFVIRLEYQNRGSQHLHMLIWIDDCPVIHEAQADEVANWVGGRITCHLPDFDESPELHRAVAQYQTHSHRLTCKTARKVVHKMKNGKLGYRFTQIDCKSGFPKPVSSGFHINDPKEVNKMLIKTGLRTDLVEIPRLENETMINPYNPIILLLCQCNMDIRPVNDKDGGCVMYISKYITKDEKPDRDKETKLFQSVKERKPGASHQSQLTSIGLQLMKSRVIGQEQAADILVGNSLFRMSTRPTYLALGKAGEIGRVLKKRQVIDADLAAGRDTSAVWDNLLSTFYPRRGEELENVCLHDLYAGFDKKTQKEFNDADPVKRLSWIECCEPTDDGYLFYHKERSLARVFYTRKMNFDTKEAKERAYWDLLQLFHPWRCDEDLTDGFANIGAAFEARKVAMNARGMEKWLNARMRIGKIEETLREYVQEAEAEMLAEAAEEDPENEDVDEVQVSDAGAFDILSGDELSLEKNKLNEDQRAIFCHVVNSIRHQRVHREGPGCPWPECKERTPLLPPVRHAVLGGAGVGKSLLISVICGQINQDVLFPLKYLSVPVDSDAEHKLRANNPVLWETYASKPTEDVCHVSQMV